VLGRRFERGPSTVVHPAVQQHQEPRGGWQKRATFWAAAVGIMSAAFSARHACCPHPSALLFLTTSSRPLPGHQPIAVLSERVSRFYRGSAGQLREQQNWTPTPCHSLRSNHAGQGVGGLPATLLADMV
jgi:hypothetical protein